MAVRYGDVPFDAAACFLRTKTAIPTEAWSDVWRDGHDTGWMVAGAMGADLLSDLMAAVLAAVEGGETLAQFAERFEAIVGAHGWTGWTGEDTDAGRAWRARVIYDTNFRTSYAAGRYAQLTDPELVRRRPYWEYVHSDAVTTPRELHLSWHRLVLRADDPWWAAHYPPNGFGCKCRVFALSESDLRRLRPDHPYPDAAPDDGTYEWIDKRSGEVHTLPNGIDPGWDYAPGATVADRLRSHLRRRLDTWPPDLATAVRRTPEVRDALDGTRLPDPTADTLCGPAPEGS